MWNKEHHFLQHITNFHSVKYRFTGSPYCWTNHQFMFLFFFLCCSLSIIHIYESVFHFKQTNSSSRSIACMLYWLVCYGQKQKKNYGTNVKQMRNSIRFRFISEIQTHCQNGINNEPPPYAHNKHTCTHIQISFLFLVLLSISISLSVFFFNFLFRPAFRLVFFSFFAAKEFTVAIKRLPTISLFLLIHYFGFIHFFSG